MRYRRLTCMLIALRRLFADIFLKGSVYINPAYTGGKKYSIIALHRCTVALHIIAYVYSPMYC